MTGAPLTQPVAQDARVTELRERFTARSEAEPVAVAKLEELLALGEEAQPGLRAAAQADWRRLDPLLLRLHYRRNREYTPAERARILTFIAMVYANTADARYLNEFLYFDRGEDAALPALCRAVFQESLDARGMHRFPIATPQEMADTVAATNARAEASPPREPPALFRIGLLGNPHAFTDLHGRLAAMGHTPRIYFFTYETSPWKRRVKGNPALARLAFLVKGCRLPYTTIRNHYKDETIRGTLEVESLDLGVQRIPFIVKNHIIEPFRVGLLNGHLAALPFVRGRSSVEFSVLHGAPVGSTVHFVDEGVDTGPIVKSYVRPWADYGCTTVETLKAAVTARTNDCFLDAVRLLSERRVAPAPNPPERGLQYFTMHPDLTHYVESALLRP